MSTWRVRAIVNRVIDGDTFDVDFDLGWGVWRRSVPGATGRVRVLGIDAPEIRDAEGPAARDLLMSILPVGSEVWVESTKLDSFGRALCNVTVGGVDLVTLLPASWRLP